MDGCTYQLYQFQRHTIDNTCDEYAPLQRPDRYLLDHQRDYQRMQRLKEQQRLEAAKELTDPEPEEIWNDLDGISDEQARLVLMSIGRPRRRR